MSRIRAFLDHITEEELIDRLDLALEGTGLGIWDWDTRDDSVNFDRRWCEMLGLVHADTPMHLETWSSRVHPDDIDGCYADIQAHLEGRTERYENTHRMQHADGHWMWILDRGRISGRDAEGRPIRFTGTHLDVTEKVRRQQREAAEQEARVESLALFAGGVAHELNSPLQIILMEAEVLQMELEGASLTDDQLRSSMDAICTTARRAGRITKALRALSRETRDDPMEPVPVATLFGHVVALCGSRASVSGISLQVPAVSPELLVCGREAELVHIFLNLVHNAIDASTDVPGASITLDVARTDGEVTLRCVDTGPGVAPEHQADLMKPWFTTKPRGRGTGLGLAVAKRLAERNHGVLRFRSDRPHTTFEVVLDGVGPSCCRTAG